MREVNIVRVEYIVVIDAMLIQCLQGTTKLPTEVVEVVGNEGVIQFTYTKRGRKGVSTVLTRNMMATSPRLKRVVMSVGLGSSKLSQLAREPTSLQRGRVP